MSRREDVDNAIWADPEFEALSPNASLLYLWSFTNPRCGMAGLYKVSRRVMTESKVPLDELDDALAELAQARFAFYQDHVLWVRARVKHLRTRTTQIAKSIASDVAKLDPEHPLRARFLDTYGDENWLRGPLRERIGATFTRGSGDVYESSRETGNSVNLTRTSPEVPGLRQGKGQRSGGTTANAQGPSTQRRVDQNALPGDFPERLASVADEVLRVLLGVHEERGGTEPTLRSVGLSIRRFPRRDHVGVARDLEHWTLAGPGQSRPVKDLGRLYATFLERAPDAAPMRLASGPRPGASESSAEYLRRRGAA